VTLRSVNPATGELVARYEAMVGAEIDRRLDRSWSTFRSWKTSPLAERSALLRQLADTLRADKDRFVALITEEMGKPITEAEAEVAKCASCCEYFAESGSDFLAAETLPSNASWSYVQFVPLGPVLAIMPWNFPLWQVIRAAVPAIMAGNTVLLKHASNVTGAALALEGLFTKAGAPAGLFQALLVPGAAVGSVIEDRRIRAVTLTGSDAAGSETGAIAGRAIKKTVLELGGSDAFIVLADADLEAAADAGVKSRFQNTGQSCIAAKRFLVVEEIADRFTELFVARVAALAVGQPTDPSTQIGPLAREDLRDAVIGQLQRSVADGATVVYGGAALPVPGYFMTPTVLADVDPTMPVFREETFGPLAPVIRVPDADAAIELANDSDFGLGSNLWSTDIDRARALAGVIEAGAVFINGMTASDPRLPFGGVKRSGHGRELGAFGIREFVNVQTVWIGPAATPSAPARSLEVALGTE
jgi:acyl-CoA reductase-like NAD-dependent aldehyde dehydrogenase